MIYSLGFRFGALQKKLKCSMFPLQLVKPSSATWPKKEPGGKWYVQHSSRGSVWNVRKGAAEVPHYYYYCYCYCYYYVFVGFLAQDYFYFSHIPSKFGFGIQLAPEIYLSFKSIFLNMTPPIYSSTTVGIGYNITLTESKNREPVRLQSKFSLGEHACWVVGCKTWQKRPWAIEQLKA